MLFTWLLAVIALLYFIALFAIARYGDTHKEMVGIRSRTTIYPLSLAIYCTTWTFFGSVGVAASSGLSFLAIYIGPILLMTIGFPIVRKIVNLSKRQRITSVADFLGARYGKSLPVAAVATLISVIGAVPYIALQLKAMSASLSQLISPQNINSVVTSPAFGDLSLYLIVFLAIFTILFGTRHADATEHQYGLMFAVAIESAIKLTAFLAVGVFVTFYVFAGPADLFNQSLDNHQIQEIFSRDIEWGNVTVLIGLSMMAFLLLPRQFHVAIVENHSEKELNRARWLFPVYLILINLFVIPIAVAGIITFGPTISGDMYVLELPGAAGSQLFSVIAFVGGLSAGTAMVIVACVALAIMISNHLILPLYLGGDNYNIREDPTDMEKRILNIRRAAIIAVLILAYSYYKVADNTQALASIGLVSFAAAAQLAPSVFIGLFWRGANSRGAIFGMIVGVTVWAYTLLLPTLMPTQLLPGFEFFHYFGFLDLGLNSLSYGVLLSITLNTTALVLFSMTRTPSSLEDHQGTVFVTYTGNKNTNTQSGSGLVTVGQINSLLSRYIGKNRAKRAVDRYWQLAGSDANLKDPASSDFIRFSEETLSSAIGSSSSRLVHSLLLRRFEETSTSNLQLLDEATEAIQYNQNVVQTAFNHLDQGITVFDAELKLSFWNKQFRKLLQLPASIGQAGLPLSGIAEEIAKKHKADRYDHSFDDLEKRLLNHESAWGLALPKIEKILEIRSSPMPEGGMVIAWHDVTERMMVAEALKDANESLEKRVADRTKELVKANHKLEQATKEADIANQSKTRFLAAAGHDILQPLNAARLYTSTLIENTRTSKTAKLGDNINSSLESVEDILSSVLAISRLDSYSNKVNISNLSVQRLFDQIEIEFRPIAQEKNLKLQFMPTSLWVKSDPSYLRRILQNLVSNALKYTNQGRVLVGCRRQNNCVSISVIDTGLGIADHEKETVFDEFERLKEGAVLSPGLGLGLSIVRRISKLLDHPVKLYSQPNKGCHFSVLIPRAEPKVQSKKGSNHKSKLPTTPLNGMNIICIDNDPNILQAMQGLLKNWGCQVTCVADSAQTLKALRQVHNNGRATIALVDYHLTDENGLDVIKTVRKTYGQGIECLLVTAERSTELKKSAEKIGVSIINKPVKPAALRAYLSQLAVRLEAAE